MTVEVVYDAINRNEESFCTAPFVCASVPFANGRFDKETLGWEVQFDATARSKCRLSHLRQISVCAGGGFPILSIHDTAKGLLDCRIFFTNTLGDSPHISVCVYDIGLTFAIEGCPRSKWEPYSRVSPVMPLYAFLDTFCRVCADAEVVFLGVEFNAKAMRGPLKRLLPPESRSVIEAAIHDNEENMKSQSE